MTYISCNLVLSLYMYDMILNLSARRILINKKIPKVTYCYVLILNLNLKCIINFLKVISILKEYFI